MFKIKNKIVLVTGATGGIGKELCRLLLKKGNRVGAIGRSEATLKVLQEELANDGAIDIFVTNIASHECVQTLAEKVEARFGTVDLLINLAGYELIKEFSDMSIAEVTDSLDVNLHACIYLTHAFQEMMKRNKEFGVVFMLSAESPFTYVTGSPYKAARAGVLGFSETLRAEFRRYGGFISTVHCGVVKTDLMIKAQETTEEGLGSHLGGMITYSKIFGYSPRKVAAKILRGAQRKKPNIFVANDLFISNPLFYYCGPLLREVMEPPMSVVYRMVAEKT
jgi:short-subunit dehydrogenase